MFGNICGNGQLKNCCGMKGTSVERSGFFCAKFLLTESRTVIVRHAKSRTHGRSHGCKEPSTEKSTIVVTDAKSRRR